MATERGINKQRLERALVLADHLGQHFYQLHTYYATDVQLARDYPEFINGLSLALANAAEIHAFTQRLLDNLP